MRSPLFHRFRMPTAILAAIISIAAGTLVAGPSSAAEKPAPSMPPSNTFSVIGDVDLNPDGTVNINTLTNAGVAAEQVQQIQTGTLQSPTSAEPNAEASVLALDGAYRILTTWKDSTGLTVPIRYGSSTWGYRKIVDKHNVTTNVARTATKYNDGDRVVESPSSIRDRTPVYRLGNCGFVTCQVLDSLVVRAIVNPTILSDGNRRGIITTYCETGIDRCPDWVKQALNAN